MLGVLLIVCVAAENWAVVLSSSKFYFNYRHAGNAVMVYNVLKRLGFDDDHIIMMVPDNAACHPRNSYPGQIFNGQSSVDQYASNIQIDYKGAEVTPDSFMQVLNDRLPPDTPVSKRLRSGSSDRVLLVMNGHGGDGYLKIQDTRVLRSVDLALAVHEMYLKGRFSELLIILDTCQAFTLFDYIKTPSVHLFASSLKGQMAKSIGFDNQLGISMSDHFSYYLYQFFQDMTKAKIATVDMQDLLTAVPSSVIKANYGYRSEKTAKELKLRNFFMTKQSQSYHPQLSVNFTEAVPLIRKYKETNQQAVQEFPETLKSLALEAFVGLSALAVLGITLLLKTI